jgi:hypothetical protein
LLEALFSTRRPKDQLDKMSEVPVELGAVDYAIGR